MNETSVHFITERKQDAENHVRFSLAMGNLDEQDYARFNIIMNLYKTRVSIDKKVAIEKSIMCANNLGAKMSMT